MQGLLIAQSATPLLAYDVMHQPLVHPHQRFQALHISALSLHV
jgi:hypothetical protein